MDLHHVRKLLSFVLAREKRIPCVELGHDAAEGPHVDGGGVGDTENDLGCPIEATLNVGVDPLVLEAAAPVVDNLDARLVRLL